MNSPLMDWVRVVLGAVAGILILKLLFVKFVKVPGLSDVIAAV